MSVALIAVNVRSRWMQLGVVLLPPTGEFMAWVLGMVTTLALFVSVFGHELSHALMARIEGIEIEEIVLHPFGGLARMRTQPESPRAEFRIAVAGPAASFLFSMIAFGALWISTRLELYFAIYLFFFVGCRKSSAGHLQFVSGLSAGRRSRAARNRLEAHR